jgi:cell division protein FtsW
MKTRKPIDFWIFMSVLILLSIGVVMVFSDSAPTAYNTMHDVYYILKKQLQYAVIGIIGMFVASNIDYRKYQKLSPYFFVGSLGLMILALVPGIGRETKGTWRWIYIGGFQFQPSELAKLSIILFFSHSLSKRKDKLNSFFKGVLPYLILVGIFIVILRFQKHMSATVIIVAVAFILLFGAGAKIRHFIIMALPAVAGLGAIIAFTDYMKDRVISYLDPWSDLQGAGWQAVQSLYAIGSGGIFGRGLGRSMQKFLYIPEPHNDFIFSVMAEELGFIGVLAVLLLFLIFIWRGIRVALNAPDMFGSLVALGITSLIAVQSLFNVAVVTASVPPTGVTLPFFSYGGTSLVLFLCEVGILLNISRYSNIDRI